MCNIRLLLFKYTRIIRSPVATGIPLIENRATVPHTYVYNIFMCACVYSVYMRTCVLARGSEKEIEYKCLSILYMYNKFVINYLDHTFIRLKDRNTFGIRG